MSLERKHIQNEGSDHYCHYYPHISQMSGDLVTQLYINYSSITDFVLLRILKLRLIGIIRHFDMLPHNCNGILIMFSLRLKLKVRDFDLYFRHTVTKLIEEQICFLWN